MIENKVRMGISQGGVLKAYTAENTAHVDLFKTKSLLLILFSISRVYLLKAQISRDCQHFFN